MKTLKITISLKRVSSPEIQLNWLKTKALVANAYLGCKTELGIRIIVAFCWIGGFSVVIWTCLEAVVQGNIEIIY